MRATDFSTEELSAAFDAETAAATPIQGRLPISLIFA
jgi:hypothetical protein